MDAHEQLIDQVKVLYADRPILGASIVASILALPEREAGLLCRLTDTPEILAASLELPLQDKGTIPGVNWRGRLQTLLQRRLKRPHGPEELWFETHVCDDGAMFSATVHVTVPEQHLDLHLTGSRTISKQAAIQSASHLAIAALDNQRP